MSFLAFENEDEEEEDDEDDEDVDDVDAPPRVRFCGLAARLTELFFLV
jgi:hypothetical protein